MTTVQHDDAWLRHPDRTADEIVKAHKAGELSDLLAHDAALPLPSAVVAAAHGPQR